MTIGRFLILTPTQERRTNMTVWKFGILSGTSGGGLCYDEVVHIPIGLAVGIKDDATTQPQSLIIGQESYSPGMSAQFTPRRHVYSSVDKSKYSKHQHLLHQAMLPRPFLLLISLDDITTVAESAALTLVKLE